MSDAATTDADPVLSHPAVLRVREALTAAGIVTEVVALGEHARTAKAAAEQLGVEVAQIANSLVFAAHAGPSDLAPTPAPDGTAPPTDAAGRHAVLVMTSGAHRVDLVRVAALLGVESLDRADPDLVRRATGFAIGGVAPVGHPVPLRTLVDVTLARHGEVWAAAGHPRTVFRTTYDQLLALTGGQAAEVA
jgi:prolyl-tRNA editing enzyme YbaK/EbsC (Cys-tRNA(Pro) deacylase)